MKMVEKEVNDYLYNRFNDFKTTKDYEAAASFIFSVNQGSITINMKREILEYICGNFEELYLLITKCKY